MPEKGLPVLPRKLSREARRAQLIEATIKVVAERGYARATLTEVASRAGLSHGLVNFHFQSKELLLTETLAYLADEYRENWARALAGAGDDPAQQLDALIRADFVPEMCAPERLSAWCSFWGEAQCRPLYQEKCGSNDAAYIATLEGIVAALMAQGGYGGDVARMARVIRVTNEGVWMDMMTQSEPYAAAEGMRTVFCAAAAIFPQHFSDEGLRR
jgi:AcrR family transcriptional regulator